MTANLVAHSDLFRAGVTTSGSYNKTLTPFGFQNERRSVWEASDVYPHWHTALESNEQLVYEMLRWFDKYLKNAPARAAAGTR